MYRNHSHTWLERHPLSKFEDLIKERFPGREILDTDPAPISINCDRSGPLELTGGSILCDVCGGIIRQNYLQQHKNSGACRRKLEKKKTRKYYNKNLPNLHRTITG